MKTLVLLSTFVLSAPSAWATQGASYSCDGRTASGGAVHIFTSTADIGSFEKGSQYTIEGQIRINSRDFSAITVEVKEFERYQAPVSNPAADSDDQLLSTSISEMDIAAPGLAETIALTCRKYGRTQY